MSLLFETIRLQNRKLHNLAYHNQRMEQSRRDLLGIDEKIELVEHIRIPDWIGEGMYRCRVSYRKEIEKIDFFEYRFSHPAIIQLIENPGLTYPYKFEDRRQFQQVLSENPGANDAIITHYGCLTDATFANVAFFDGKDWLTPDVPLLKGTKRQYLLENKILIATSIRVEHLKDFRQLSLINAMRDLNIVYDYTFHHNHLMIHGNY